MEGIELRFISTDGRVSEYRLTPQQTEVKNLVGWQSVCKYSEYVVHHSICEDQPGVKVSDWGNPFIHTEMQGRLRNTIFCPLLCGLHKYM